MPHCKCYCCLAEREPDACERLLRGFPVNISQGCAHRAYRSTKDESESNHSVGYAAALSSKSSNQVVCSGSTADIMEVTNDKHRSSRRHADATSVIAEKRYELRCPSTSMKSEGEVRFLASSAASSSTKSSNQNPTAEKMEVTVDKQRSSSKHAGSSSAVTENRYDLRSTSSHDSVSCQPDRQRLTDSSKSWLKKLLTESAASHAADVKLNDKEKSYNESKYVEPVQNGGKCKNTGSSGKKDVSADVQKKEGYCKKDASQTTQNLMHSVRDQRLSSSSTRSSFGRGKVGAESKLRGAAKRHKHVHSETFSGDCRSIVPSTHTSADRHLFTLDSKGNRSAKLDDTHAAHIDRDSTRWQGRRSGRAMPVCSLSTREYSTKTCNYISLKKTTKKVCLPKEVSVSEDWEDELFVFSPSQHVNSKTDHMQEAVGESYDNIDVRSTAFTKEDSVFEDWEDELLMFPSVGCNMTVELDNVACSVNELCMEVDVKMSPYDLSITVDDESTASTNNNTKTLLTFEDNHSDKQKSALSSEVKTDIDCALEQLQSEMFDAVAGEKRVAQATASPAKEATGRFVLVRYKTDIEHQIGIPKYDAQTVDSGIEKCDQQIVNILLPSDSTEQFECQSMCEDIEPYKIRTNEVDECHNYLLSEEHPGKTFHGNQLVISFI